MTYIPEEIVTDILSRLRVKPLLRFRCVAEKWRALIDGPYFIDFHLTRSIRTKSNHHLLLTSEKIHSLDLDSPHELVEINDEVINDLDEFSIVGSCNGLLCLSCYEKDTLVLWNPSTHHFRVLPPIDFTYLDTLDATHIAYAFGHDHVNRDYKVVRIVEFESHVSSFVYSLNSNSWRKILDFPYFLHLVHSNGVLVSGALHWIVYENMELKSKSIVALDLATEEYRLVALPPCLNNEFDMKLVPFEGWLCLICDIESSSSVDIWAMRESWAKLAVATQIGDIDINIFEAVKPLLISKRGEHLLWEMDNTMLVWIDDQYETDEEIKVRDLPDCFSANVYVGSLVQLNGGNGSDLQKQHAQDKGNKEKKVSNKRKFPFEGVQTCDLNNWKRWCAKQ